MANEPSEKALTAASEWLDHLLDPVAAYPATKQSLARLLDQFAYDRYLEEYRVAKERTDREKAEAIQAARHGFR